MKKLSFVFACVLFVGLFGLTVQAMPKKVTVDMIFHMTEFEEWFSKMETYFEKKHPNIDWRIIWANDPQNQKIITTRLASDNPPGIVYAYGPSAINILKNDLAVNLDEIADLQDILPKYPARAWDIQRAIAGRKKGKWAIPSAAYYVGVFYDKAIWDKFGLTEPETTDGWWTLLDKMEAVPELDHAVAWGNHPWIAENLEILLVAYNGPDIFEKLARGEAKFNDPGVVKAWEYYSRVGEKYADENWLENEWGILESRFARGHYGVILQGSWVFGSYPKANPDVELRAFPFPTPTGKDRRWIALCIDEGWYMPKGFEHRKEQVEVFKFLTGSYFAQRMIADIGLLPFYQQEYKVEVPVIEYMVKRGFDVAGPHWYTFFSPITPPGAKDILFYVWENLPQLTSGKLSPSEFGTMVEKYVSPWRK